MSETKYPGGAYISADGKTWHDANGKTIPAPVVREDGETIAEPSAEVPQNEKPATTDKVTPPPAAARNTRGRNTPPPAAKDADGNEHDDAKKKDENGGE